MGNVFPFNVPPLHNPYTIPCQFSTHGSTAAVHFLKQCSRVALLLPSPPLQTQNKFLSMQISPWGKKNCMVSDLVSTVDIPSLGTCVSQETSSHRGHCMLVQHFEFSPLLSLSGRAAGAWIVFNIFFKSLKPLKNLSIR